MIERLHTDHDLVRAIVDEWLAADPALEKLLRGTIGHPRGWRVRADLEADGQVWVSLVSPGGASIAVWHGPRALVERAEPAAPRMLQ